MLLRQPYLFVIGIALATLSACNEDDDAPALVEDVTVVAERVPLEVVSFSQLPTLEPMAQPGRVLWRGFQTDRTNRTTLYEAERVGERSWSETQRPLNLPGASINILRIGDDLLVHSTDSAFDEPTTVLYPSRGRPSALRLTTARDSIYSVLFTAFATPHGFLFRRFSRSVDSFSIAWLPSGETEAVDVARLPGWGERGLVGIAADPGGIYGTFAEQEYKPAVVTYTPFRFDVAEPVGTFHTGDPVRVSDALLSPFEIPGVVGSGVYVAGQYDQRPQLIRWTLPDLGGGVQTALEEFWGPVVDDNSTTITDAGGASRAFADGPEGQGRTVRELRPEGFREVWDGRRLRHVRYLAADTLTPWQTTLFRADDLFRAFHAEAGLVYVRNAQFVIAVDEADGSIARIWTTAGAPAGGVDEEVFITDAHASGDSLYIAAVSRYDFAGVTVFYASFAK